MYILVSLLICNVPICLLAAVWIAMHTYSKLFVLLVVIRISAASQEIYNATAVLRRGRRKYVGMDLVAISILDYLIY